MPRRFVHRQRDTERRGNVGEAFRAAPVDRGQVPVPVRPAGPWRRRRLIRRPRRERGAGRSPGRRRSCDLARWVARAASRPPALAVVSISFTLQPGRASRAATLISRSGIAQRSSQVNWTMIMSSRGWHALHGLAGLPAALGTGIRRAGGVRTGQFRLQARRSRRAGRSPACPRFCSHFAPRTDRFGVTPYGRDPQHRAELWYFRAGSQDPGPRSPEGAAGLRIKSAVAGGCGR